MKLLLAYLFMVLAFVFVGLALYAEPMYQLPLSLVAMLCSLLGIFTATQRNKSMLVRRYRVNGKWVEEPLERPRKK